MEPSAHTGLYAAPEQLHALLHCEDKPPVDELDNGKSRLSLTFGDFKSQPPNGRCLNPQATFLFGVKKKTSL